MLKMTLSETENVFKVTFSHDRGLNETKCTILEYTKDGEYVDRYVGWSYCHHSDQFNKETGRKVAFTRAISEGFTRYERRQLWEQYFNRGKK